MKTLVIAGVQSGSGKTTVATGVMAALAARTQVQPFKVGPDYIDPSYHSRVCGRPSRNLDTWMLSPATVLELFQRAVGDAGIAIVEGVMGLYDGRTGGGEAGSTAEVAKLLHAPVVLVLDASHMARSAAAVVVGFRAFDPGVRIAGVILNRIVSPRHYEAVAGPIEREAGVPVLGALPRDDRLALPERYLGLVPTVEGPVADGYFDFLRDTCRRSIDLDRLERIAAAAGAAPQAGERGPARAGPHPAPLPEGAGTNPTGRAPAEPSLFPESSMPPAIRVAVARDRAFSFYYEDNLDLLRAWGAEIVFFSPLADSKLPEDTAGVYLGGGFPELFAADLAANRPMLLALRAAAAAGMPVYGECGGLMYLGAGLTDADGRTYTMAEVVPARSSMSGARPTLGYRELRALRPSPLLEPGSAVRAHEFHWSRLAETPDPEHTAYAVDGDARLEGYCSGSVLASYMHLHFAASATIAPRFVDACRRWQQSRANAGSTALRGRKSEPVPRNRARSGPG